MQNLIAKKTMRYGIRRLKAGDAFTAPPRDAKVLIAIGQASLAPVAPLPPEPAPRRVYKRRDMSAEPGNAVAREELGLPPEAFALVAPGPEPKPEPAAD